MLKLGISLIRLIGSLADYNRSGNIKIESGFNLLQETGDALLLEG